MSNVLKCRVLSREKKIKAESGKEPVCVADFARIPMFRRLRILANSATQTRSASGSRFFAKDAKDAWVMPRGDDDDDDRLTEPVIRGNHARASTFRSIFDFHSDLDAPS